MAKHEENNQISSAHLVYGVHPVEELLRQQPAEIEEIVVSGRHGGAARVAQKAEESGMLVYYRPRAVLDQLVPGVNHQGIVARLREFAYRELEDLLNAAHTDPLLFVAGIQDPGNLGALLRSARGFGVAGVILSFRGSCGITSAVVRASAGATASLDIARVRNANTALDQLKQAGWWLVGLDASGTPLERFDLVRPTVLILGTEGKGLPPSIQKRCDALLQIPMEGNWDSLNVAVAGAVALYEWRRQNRSSQQPPLPKSQPPR